MKRLPAALLGTALLTAALPAGAATVEEIAGSHVFERCKACHSAESGKQGFGPNLHGVVGRPAASLPTFMYSEALKAANIVWTEDNLRAWIAGNDKVVPGTRMRHVAVTDRAEQDYLIAYLKTFGDSMGPEQARVLLERAVGKLRSDGPDKAFPAFNDPKGGFIARDLYVFVFDMNGRYMASGGNPRLTGSDAANLHDAEGKAIVREMINIANAAGKGEVDYMWLNRVDNRVEKKRSMIQRVGDHIVGVGYYFH
ncbi:cache sensor protein [Paramagnetospirillum caucaseum]|uniref:Cache sensor protein n=1 Tax=Paramagnetospirillum caucaseum TaxID=1244869 RepID=M3AAH2_9PROT|nr:cache domain-containing protein [Paramagnetospirillum caucaseum]EME69494.1 cache sensor protein [Paramagnetospirillum caucaseum]